MNEQYVEDLLRFVAATLWGIYTLQASREIFGKEYTQLGVAEKGVLDSPVPGQIRSNMLMLTPDILEKLRPAAGRPVGFQPPPNASQEKPQEKK